MYIFYCSMLVMTPVYSSTCEHITSHVFGFHWLFQYHIQYHTIAMYNLEPDSSTLLDGLPSHLIDYYHRESVRAPLVVVMKDGTSVNTFITTNLRPKKKNRAKTVKTILHFYQEIFQHSWEKLFTFQTFLNYPEFGNLRKVINKLMSLPFSFVDIQISSLNFTITGQAWCFTEKVVTGHWRCFYQSLKVIVHI